MLIGLHAYGQVESETIFERMDFENPVRSYVRPQFSDSTLLFYSDSLVWNCSIGDGYIYSYYDVDFSKVDSCICYQEIYQKLPAIGSANSQGSWSKYRFELLDKVKRAKLIKENLETFEYDEYNEKGELIKSEKLLFDWNNIVFVDSLYSPDNQGQMGLTITKWIEVKNK